MRRFPTPWRVEKIPGGYTVGDATDRVLVRVYGQDEAIEGGVAAITLDEAEEMALTIAMLPQTLSECERLHLRLKGSDCNRAPPRLHIPVVDRLGREESRQQRAYLQPMLPAGQLISEASGILPHCCRFTEPSCERHILQPKRE